mmetsp:Transcript_4867/g.8804  ORF Transcript_4867/g.8804 Transcript_4867/m.8804 type:complete len:151 (-) Transcript_4867:733-1185(-)
MTAATGARAPTQYGAKKDQSLVGVAMLVTSPMAAMMIVTDKMTMRLLVCVPHNISPNASASKAVDASHISFKTLFVASDGQQAMGKRKNGDNGINATEMHSVKGAAMVYQSPAIPILPKATVLIDSGPRYFVMMSLVGCIYSHSPSPPPL